MVGATICREARVCTLILYFPTIGVKSIAHWISYDVLIMSTHINISSGFLSSSFIFLRDVLVFETLFGNSFMWVATN